MKGILHRSGIWEMKNEMAVEKIRVMKGVHIRNTFTFFSTGLPPMNMKSPTTFSTKNDADINDNIMEC